MWEQQTFESVFSKFKPTKNVVISEAGKSKRVEKRGLSPPLDKRSMSMSTYRVLARDQLISRISLTRLHNLPILQQNSRPLESEPKKDENPGNTAVLDQRIKALNLSRNGFISAGGLKIESIPALSALHHLSSSNSDAPENALTTIRFKKLRPRPSDNTKTVLSTTHAPIASQGHHQRLLPSNKRVAAPIRLKERGAKDVTQPALWA